jgi:hypothetical protein
VDHFLSRDTLRLDIFKPTGREGKTLLDFACTSHVGPSWKTVKVLLDSRLIDRGLVDPAKAYEHLSKRMELAGNSTNKHSDIEEVAQRLRELGYPKQEPEV